MNILHINYSDHEGGAAIAAYRLHIAMCNHGMNSSLLVIDKKRQDKQVYSITKRQKFFNKIFQRLTAKLLKGKIKYGAFSINLFGADITNNPLVKKADIIYLHWINKDFLSLNDLRKLLQLQKPVIFYMHDMWSITGGCHHSLNCKKYETQCQKCPLLSSHIDLAKIVFNKKYKSIQNYSQHIHVISPSNWLGNLVQNSNIFKNVKITIIHNVINHDIFKLVDPEAARSFLNIPNDPTKIRLTFGAATGGTNNPYKGWNNIVESLKLLDENKYEIIIFGESDEETLSKTFKQRIYFLGPLTDEYTLSCLYNATDILLVPSIAENYPNIILESLSCGTPVVAMNVGGIPDLIDHKINGYLCNPMENNGLIEGIYYIEQLYNDSDRSNIKESIYNSSLKKFSTSQIIEQHKKLIKVSFQNWRID